ncbi:MAG: hypothetical protein ACK41V_08530 [Acidovorax sp.]|uniref:hypothetical protein n=1 Tax=Acidovorax sp. TaxID=1872122 RepID=UPI00391D0822
MNPTQSLDEVLSMLTHASDLLNSADRAWPDAFEREFAGLDAPERLPLEEQLHLVSHETGLAFAIQDIRLLIAKLRVRARYKVFSHKQFDYIVSRGWTTGLVTEIHVQHPTRSLAEISGLVKGACYEWGEVAHVSSPPIEADVSHLKR